MRDEWPFVNALLSNAEMACAKADLHIERRYEDLCEDDDVRRVNWRATARRGGADPSPGDGGGTTENALG